MDITCQQFGNAIRTEELIAIVIYILATFQDAEACGTEGNHRWQVAVHLGKGVKYVDILNENDCVKVKPKD
jgi:hypothetical protein